MRNLFFSIFLLLIASCSSPISQSSAFPPLELPEWLEFSKTKQPSENGQIENEQPWFYCLERAEKFLHAAQYNLDTSTKILYSILSSQDAVHFPAIPIPYLQRVRLSEEAKKDAFLSLRLQKAEMDLANEAWRNLTNADREFLCAGFLIAELRQKWREFAKFHEQTPSSWRRFEFVLEQLPTLAYLEAQRKEIQAMEFVCRRLSFQNDGIFPVPLD